jgi:hypothetical protein
LDAGRTGEFWAAAEKQLVAEGKQRKSFAKDAPPVYVPNRRRL